MVPRTAQGKYRKLTSGDGRKNVETDLKNEFDETLDVVEKDIYPDE